MQVKGFHVTLQDCLMSSPKKYLAQIYFIIFLKNYSYSRDLIDKSFPLIKYLDEKIIFSKIELNLIDSENENVLFLIVLDQNILQYINKSFYKAPLNA